MLVRLVMKVGRWSIEPLLNIFPEVSVCVFVAVLETSSATSLFPLSHMCSLVLSKTQSAAVMRSPGADFALREEVLVYSCLTLFLTSIFFGAS